MSFFPTFGLLHCCITGFRVVSFTSSSRHGVGYHMLLLAMYRVELHVHDVGKVSLLRVASERGEQVEESLRMRRAGRRIDAVQLADAGDVDVPFGLLCEGYV